MRPRVVVAAAALAVSVLGAALWALSPDVSADGQSDRGGVDPVITADEPWNAYPAAGVEAVLVLHEDCLLLGEYVVFWPYGTTGDGIG